MDNIYFFLSISYQILIFISPIKWYVSGSEARNPNNFDRNSKTNTLSKKEHLSTTIESETLMVELNFFIKKISFDQAQFWFPINVTSIIISFFVKLSLLSFILFIHAGIFIFRHIFLIFIMTR